MPVRLCKGGRGEENATVHIISILKDHCVILSKYQSVYLRGGMADDSTTIVVKVINLAS